MAACKSLVCQRRSNPMNLRNPLIRAVMAVAAGLVPASAALGQDASYPGKPVRMIVPFGSGGTPDTIARVITQRLGESLGQPFVVENRPGANGILGREARTGRRRAGGKG